MRQALLDRHLPPEKLTVQPTGVDLALYDHAGPDNRLRHRLGWQGRLIAVYAGAVSDANGLEYVVEAAAAVKDDPRIGFIIIGDGRRKPELVDLAARQGLNNIHFKPSMPKDQLIHVLPDCDVGMLILRPLPEFAPLMPNKLFDYLAAGLAVMVNFEGEAAGEVSACGAGGATDSTDARSLARRVQEYASDAAALAGAKSAARELARKYDRADLAKKLERTLQEAAGL
jgi:glycosyltransferase involved in cell wall biosynthesis